MRVTFNIDESAEHDGQQTKPLSCGSLILINPGSFSMHSIVWQVDTCQSMSIPLMQPYNVLQLIGHELLGPVASQGGIVAR